MATKKKKKGSYNPFYIPSLDALKSQSRQEAQAQIDASVAALPKQGDIQGQFDKSGREFAAMDSAYTGFLKNQQVAAPALFDTGTDVQATTGTGVVDPGAAQTAQQASNALKMQGFGFANARESAISGSAAKANENQQRNRRQLNDAILQLTNQIAAEKAKFSPLYFQTLNQKKADALQAYQAYLGNQLNSAQLGAQVSNDQAQIDIGQQNADTAAQRAADAAAKAAATKDKAATNARVKLRDKAYTLADSMLKDQITTDKNVRHITYHVLYKQSSGGNTTTKFLTVEFPETVSQDEVFAKVKKDNPSIISWAGIDPYKSRVEKVKVTTPRYNYKNVYGRLKARLKAAKYTEKQAQRLAHAYLDHLADLVGSPAWNNAQAVKSGNEPRPGGDQ